VLRLGEEPAGTDLGQESGEPAVGDRRVKRHEQAAHLEAAEQGRGEGRGVVDQQRRHLPRQGALLEKEGRQAVRPVLDFLIGGDPAAALHRRARREAVGRLAKKLLNTFKAHA
jgi:hypothetical protein